MWRAHSGAGFGDAGRPAQVGSRTASYGGLEEAPTVAVGWLDRGAAQLPDRSVCSHLSGQYLLSHHPHPFSLQGQTLIYLRVLGYEGNPGGVPLTRTGQLLARCGHNIGE